MSSVISPGHRATPSTESKSLDERRIKRRRMAKERTSSWQRDRVHEGTASHPVDFTTSLAASLAPGFTRYSTGLATKTITPITGGGLDPPHDYQRALKIDFIEIVGNPTESHEPLSLAKAEVRTRCTISIYNGVYIQTLDGPKLKDREELLRTSKIGSFQTDVDSLGRGVTRVILPSPFIIPAEQLFIRGRENGKQREFRDDKANRRERGFFRFDLADHYIMKVWFESANTEGNWPPLDLANTIDRATWIGNMLDAGSMSHNDILLGCSSGLFLDKGRQEQLNIDLQLGKMYEKTQFTLKTDISWSLPLGPHISAPKSYYKLSKAKQIAVIYALNPQSSSVQAVVKGLRCAFCQRKQPSIDGLKFHLATIHDDFDFHFWSMTPNTLHVRFAQCNSISKDSDNHKTARCLQLGRARTRFDLAKYLKGDKTWISSRQGPDNDCELTLIHGSAFSHPTSAPTTPGIDYEDRLQSHRPAFPFRKPPRVKVPKTHKPLYDNITKQILHPGDELNDNEAAAGESLRNAKLADMINSRNDLTEDQKDYMIKWDNFLRPFNITCKAYMPEATIRFIEENLDWFSKRRSRLKEFGTHVTRLHLMGSIDTECVVKCSSLLRPCARIGSESWMNAGERVRKRKT